MKLGASLGAQLKQLLSHSAVYGAADVFTSAVSFLLLPLFTRYLTREDYGVLAVLLLVSTLAKVLFRLGLDAAFFRVYYDQETDAARRALAGTAAAFAALVGTLLFAAVLLGAPLILSLLFSGKAPPASWVVLAAADVYLGCFAFVPLALLRIQNRPGTFSAYSVARHGVNIGLKVWLVVAGWGVPGVLVSDLVATGLFALALAPVLARSASARFARGPLVEMLRFGLPKVPHGLMVQAQNLADRRILEAFVPLAEVGVYQVGYTLGTAVKFALSAFEPAWQPFVYAQIRSPDARTTLARLATYVFAGFCAAALAVAALSPEIVRVMTAPAFHAAAPIVPVVALAYLLHGVFLLTSIGIAIEKKARYYPLITALSAGTNIVANLLLVPRHGLLGAAWATVASYGLMAWLGFRISRRLYPIPFEGGRFAHLAAASLAVYALSLLAPEDLAASLAVKLLLLAGFPALLLGSGFFTPEERAWLKRRLGIRHASDPRPPTPDL